MTGRRDTPDAPGPLPPLEDKATYVQEMFGRIARRYDLMNRLMTLGRDRAWRRYTVSQILPALPPYRVAEEGVGRLLDVATGTGDLAFEALRQRPGLKAVGLDFVAEMLALAQQKHAGQGPALELAAGDALHVPFRDKAFDAVVTGFALRNVTSIAQAFAEMARVTRAGGRVACLEIAKPRLPVFRYLFQLYFYHLVPLIGGLISGQRAAYTYLPHSLTRFLSPHEIAEVMRQTGWREVRYKRLMLGTVAVHVGVRE
jgi:demethylmenaquinone methyltransferase/2-methoxy-6-polyprenyl-1,4-benzoquinol methylase